MFMVDIYDISWYIMIYHDISILTVVFKPTYNCGGATLYRMVNISSLLTSWPKWHGLPEMGRQVYPTAKGMIGYEPARFPRHNSNERWNIPDAAAWTHIVYPGDVRVKWIMKSPCNWMISSQHDCFWRERVLCVQQSAGLRKTLQWLLQFQQANNYLRRRGYALSLFAMETIFGAYGMAGETITHQPGPSRAQQGPSTAPKYKTPPTTRATHPNSWLIMEHSIYLLCILKWMMTGSIPAPWLRKPPWFRRLYPDLTATSQQWCLWGASIPKWLYQRNRVGELLQFIEVDGVQ